MFRKCKERDGFALTELLLAIICSLVIITVAFTMYSRAKDRQVTMETIRGLQTSIQNIRTYYAFEGTYEDISEVTGDEFYSKEFAVRSWKCPADKKFCTGPENITMSLDKAKAGTESVYDAFTVSLSGVPANACIEILQTNWHNTKEIKVTSGDGKSATFKDNDVPVSAKKAIPACSAHANSLVLTLQ